MVNNLHFQRHIIKRTDKERLNKHKGIVIWLTGLPGSGKSTIARHLEQKLFNIGCHTIILDGDNIRCGLNSDLGFSRGDRKENIRRVGEVAKLTSENGLITIVSFVSPYRKDRDAIRSNMKKGDFIEVFIKCNIGECIRRDPKGLYKKAKAKSIDQFTGVSATYQPPTHPEIIIDTQKYDIDRSVGLVLEYLHKKGRIK